MKKTLLAIVIAASLLSCAGPSSSSRREEGRYVNLGVGIDTLHIGKVTYVIFSNSVGMSVVNYSQDSADYDMQVKYGDRSEVDEEDEINQYSSHSSMIRMAIN